MRRRDRKVLQRPDLPGKPLGNRKRLCLILLLTLLLPLLLSSCAGAGKEAGGSAVQETESGEADGTGEEALQETEDTETREGSLLYGLPDTVDVEDPEPEPLSGDEVIDPEIADQLEKAEEKDLSGERETVSVDLIVFAGQSNMSGYCGDPSEAPALTEGAGGEFRAISDPFRLYTIIEPFGFYENTAVMNDFFLKRGTLVTAFINAYYEETGVPVVAVSAAKGGTPSTYWASEVVGMEVENRFKSAKSWLTENGYTVRNQFLVFLQGENDVLENISTEQYLTDINVFSSRMFYAGIDKFLMIRIGGEKEDPEAFARIRDIQTELCRSDPRFVLVSGLFSAFDGSHMKDDYHYDQEALNAVGEDAGRNAAYFAKYRKDPEISDPLTGGVYVPLQFEGL